MPRKRRPFAPLAPLTPFALLLPRIKLNLTSIAFILSANTFKLSRTPSKSLTLISMLMPYFEIDMPKSKKPKIEPPVKIISYSIEFRIYLNKVKKII